MITFEAAQVQFERIRDKPLSQEEERVALFFFQKGEGHANNHRGKKTVDLMKEAREEFNRFTGMNVGLAHEGVTVFFLNAGITSVNEMTGLRPSYGGKLSVVGTVVVPLLFLLAFCSGG